MYFLDFSRNGWAVLRTNSLEEAIEWSKRFRKIVGDGKPKSFRYLGRKTPGQREAPRYR